MGQDSLHNEHANQNLLNWSKYYAMYATHSIHGTAIQTLKKVREFYVILMFYIWRLIVLKT